MNLSWVPNAISGFRVLLILPLVLCLFERSYDTALVLIVIAGFSDGVDGVLARSFDWRTRLGSLLDPAADKLLLVTTFVSLAWLKLVPPGLAVIVVLRDLIIVGGALGYRRLAGHLRGEPTLISKINTGCQLLFIIAVLMQAQWQWPGQIFALLLGALVVFTSITSGINYVLTWSQRAQREVGAV